MVRFQAREKVLGAFTLRTTVHKVLSDCGPEAFRVNIPGVLVYLGFWYAKPGVPSHLGKEYSPPPLKNLYGVRVLRILSQLELMNYKAVPILSCLRIKIMKSVVLSSNSYYKPSLS
jgi:hypothetical protein